MRSSIFVETSSAYYESSPPVTDELIVQAECRLGYKLPDAFIALLKIRNGGYLRNRYYYQNERFCITTDYFFGIGDHRNAIDRIDENEKTINQNLIENWNYPNTGFVLCHLGHGGIFLDYSNCGRLGEPKVIYVLAEYWPRIEITEIATSFSEFIEGLNESDDRNT